MVEGRIAGREFTDGAGVDRRITEIVVGRPQDTVNVLSAKPNETAAAGASGTGADADDAEAE